MKAQNRYIKDRKVAGFFENILRNFGTIILGGILFGLIFMGYYLINSKVAEKMIDYAGIIGVSVKYQEGTKDKVSLDKFKEIIAGQKVQKMIQNEVSLEGSYDNFIQNASVSYEDGIFTIAFFDDDSTYATTVVNKLYNAVSVVLMSDYSVEVVNIEKPAYFMVYNKTNSVDDMGLKDYTVLGGLFGIAFSVIAVCTFYLLDNTVKDSVDVRKYYDLPVLAVIPPVKEKDEE